jgi:hypothetical protein
MKVLDNLSINSQSKAVLNDFSIEIKKGEVIKVKDEYYIVKSCVPRFRCRVLELEKIGV